MVISECGPAFTAKLETMAKDIDLVRYSARNTGLTVLSICIHSLATS
jgi:hypothetical protein